MDFLHSFRRPRRVAAPIDLSRERWESITDEERQRTANLLAQQLPTGFDFRGIRRCRLGEQQHDVAFYGLGESAFALIPGGSADLGFNSDRLWEPNADELASWEETRHAYNLQT